MPTINLENATQGIIFCRVDGSSTAVTQLSITVGFGHFADVIVKLGQRTLAEFNTINPLPIVNIGPNQDIVGKRLRISVLIQKQSPTNESSLDLTLTGIPTQLSRGFTANRFGGDGTVHYVIDIKFKP